MDKNMDILFILDQTKHSNILGFRCKSDIVIFAWSITWNHANSPFQKNFYLIYFTNLFHNLVVCCF